MTSKRKTFIKKIEVADAGSGSVAESRTPIKLKGVTAAEREKLRISAYSYLLP